MNTAAIFGLVIVFAGVSVILQAAFGIRVPVFRVGFGLLMLYWGGRVLMGAWSERDNQAPSAAVMQERSFVAPRGASGPLKYEAIFGSTVVDLTQLGLDPSATAEVEVNTIFASSLVRVDPATPTEIEAHAAFGECRLPDMQSVAFGELHYRNPSARAAPPRLRVKINAVFGSVHVVERAGPLLHSDPAHASAR